MLHERGKNNKPYTLFLQVVRKSPVLRSSEQGFTFPTASDWNSVKKENPSFRLLHCRTPIRNCMTLSVRSSLLTSFLFSHFLLFFVSCNSRLASCQEPLITLYIRIKIYIKFFSCLNAFSVHFVSIAIVESQLSSPLIIHPKKTQRIVSITTQTKQNHPQKL